MRKIKPILLILSLLVFMQTGLGNRIISEDTPEKWVVIKEGELSVEGKTNINSFTCVIKGYSNSDTILVQPYTRQGTPFQVSGKLCYNLNEFKCPNRLMSLELKSTLKTEKYPQMIIEALSFENLPDLRYGEQAVNGIVSIQLHGVKRQFDVTCLFREDSKGIIHIICKKDVNLTDFKIVPPRRLAGLVRVKDKMHIRLNFALMQIHA